MHASSTPGNGDGGLPAEDRAGKLPTDPADIADLLEALDLLAALTGPIHGEAPAEGRETVAASAAAEDGDAAEVGDASEDELSNDPSAPYDVGFTDENRTDVADEKEDAEPDAIGIARSPTTSVRETAATQEADDSEFDDPPVLSRLLVGVTATLVVAGLVVAGIWLVHNPHRSPHSQASGTRTLTRLNLQAENWVVTNVPTNVPVLADMDVSLSLVANNINAQFATPPQGCSAKFQYVVSTPALRARAGSDSAARDCLEHSTAVVTFGGGDDAVSVQQVMGADPSERATLVARRQQAQEMAGRGLVENANLTFSTATRKAIRAGALDLRAATALAVIAGSTHVAVLGLTYDAGEKAAGAPIRVLTIRVRVPTLIATTIKTLPASYRPAKAVSFSDGSTTLTWAPMLVPTLPTG
ncbi:hypothetical protein ACSMXN_12435 [Jatrophihabitans sp. DSM 45814]